MAIFNFFNPSENNFIETKRKIYILVTEITYFIEQRSINQKIGTALITTKIISEHTRKIGS